MSNTIIIRVRKDGSSLLVIMHDLVMLITFILGGTYKSGHVFSEDQSKEVTSAQTIHYLRVKLYGNKGAQSNINPPTSQKHLYTQRRHF